MKRRPSQAPAHWLATILMMHAALLVACNGAAPAPPASVMPTVDPPSEADSTPDAAAVTPVTTATLEPFSGSGPWTAAFDTSDGGTLQGTLYGQGVVGVVLAPMYIVGQEGWASIAETLAAQGYRVLTFDYRGYGPSAGERDTTSAPIDVAAAVAFMKEHEFQPVVLLGAGIGGSAAIKVAAQDGDIVGLAILSAPRAFQGLEVSDADLATLSMPTLWIAARNDMTQNVEEMQALAPTTDSTLWIYEGSSLQGTFIFEGADGPDLQQRLLEFVARVAGTP